jgi:hypothetical protein
VAGDHTYADGPFFEELFGMPAIAKTSRVSSARGLCQLASRDFMFGMIDIDHERTMMKMVCQ